MDQSIKKKTITDQLKFSALTLMVLACSEVREALAKVSSSTKTAFLRRSFWRDSKLEVISVRFAMAPLHRSSLPMFFPFSCSICLFQNFIDKPRAYERCNFKPSHSLRIIASLFLMVVGLGFILRLTLKKNYEKNFFFLTTYIFILKNRSGDFFYIKKKPLI